MYMDDTKIFAKNGKELETLNKLSKSTAEVLGLNLGLKNVPYL